LEGTARADEIRSPAPLLHRDNTYFQGNFVRRTTFVGREMERAALRRYLDQVLRGFGAVVMIAGTAGVGKTRITAEFSLEASEKRVLTLMGACYDRDDPLPFIPFVEMLEPMLGASSLADVREELGEDIAEIARLLPQLRRLFPDIPPPLELPPEQSRRVLFNAVARMLARISTKQPVLLILDDLHWADEGTLSLVTHLGPLVSKIPVLIVGTYRDFELRPSQPLAKLFDELIRYHVLDEISLSGLPKPAVAQMIETISGRQPPDEVASLIYSETEGNPFFVEELLEHLLEQDQLLDKNGELRRDLNHGEIIIPRTVRMVIGRRLTRLSNGAQRVLVTAAVIGRAFTLKLLQESSHVDEDSLLDWIEEAERAGLIRSTWHYPDMQFRFSHELIRQTVANELSSARRQRLHLDIADAIERLYPDTLQDHIDDLAHHLWEAGVAAEASRTLNCLRLASKKANRQSAYGAVIRYLRNGLEVVKRLPRTAERVHRELRLYLDLRNPLIAIKGFVDSEVEEVCKKAQELLEELGDAPESFSVISGLTAMYLERGELKIGLELGEKMLRVGEHNNNPGFLVWAHYALGYCLMKRGEYIAARSHFERSLALYDPKLRGAYGFVYDPQAAALGQLAGLVHRLGYPDLALKTSTDALKAARDLSHPFTLVFVLVCSGNVFIRRGDGQGAISLFEEAIDTTIKHGLNSMLGQATIGMGRALVSRGYVQEGIARICEGRTKFKGDAVYWQAPLALAYGRAGQPDNGLRIVSEALIDEMSSERRGYLAWLYRINGELLLMHNARIEAEHCFDQGITIARNQSDKSGELAATIHLARMIANNNKNNRRRAYAMLSEIYTWFTEGFDTTELKKAKALLDELKD
jgi:tetratricopeptide (TPR) repeat protein